MKPIVTLTLNPTIDGATEAEVVQPIRKIRTSNERYDPGGGGINVARVIGELGGPALAIYFAGGPTGSLLHDLLDRTRTKHHRVEIAGNTRISHTVYDRSSGLEYRFVPGGPRLRTEEWQRSLALLADLDFDWLVASGSLPGGVPADFYVKVGDIVRAKGAKLVLDTSGTALRTSIEAGGIRLLKPSLGELEELVGSPLPDAAGQEKAAMSIIASGKAELMAVTLGHHGAFLARPEGVHRMPALAMKPRSAVGAGDSFLAAMTLRLAQGVNAADAFLFGMAAGTAAVLTPGTELCRRDDVERLFTQLQAIERGAG